MARITFLLFVVLFATNVSAQNAQLRLSIDLYMDELRCPAVTISDASGVVYSDDFFDSFYEEIDSLEPGTYQLVVSDCTTPQLIIMNTEFELYADSITTLDLSHTNSLSYEAIADTLAKHRLDTQLMMGYTNNRFFEDDPALTSSASVGFSQSAWFAFSRHFGFLTGGGMRFTHSSIAKDTSFMDQVALGKKYEYYNYLDVHATAALRLSTKNQQREYEFSGFTVDIGASYHLPLLFKHVARYGGNQKFMEGGLHQFTDVRAFVNIGYAPVLLFAEYRLSDFILGSYPELPILNFGMKIDLQN